MTKQEEIEQLKTEQGMVILARHYVDPQAQEIANYIGDSFYLSRVAAGFGRRTMMLCGVSFVGESGKLLSPDKMVLTPDAQVDCPMAHMVTKEEVEQYRKEYPDLAVVCYINSTVEIKSWSDVCVTSANAVRIVRNLSDRDILFIPNKNLERCVASQVPEGHMIPVNGYCPAHDQVSPGEVSALEETHPDAQVLAHPKYNAQILKLAGYIGSTTGILKFAAGSTSRESIICTENGMRRELERQDPGKHFYFPDTEPICRDMKKITLDRIVHVLHTGRNRAPVPRAYVPSAGGALEQVLNLAR